MSSTTERARTVPVHVVPDDPKRKWVRVPMKVVYVEEETGTLQVEMPPGSYKMLDGIIESAFAELDKGKP
ncbi:MAG: hypothetical protein P4L69_11290 [Desulfosporosinus sp.]|nr:hypothetical protein [Desulfosporosinus sp.]